MVLPYDVLCCAMCESILKPTDIVACLTVCRLWYDAAIYQLLATITFDARLGCTFWLAYFQRHPELRAFVRELCLNGRGDPFRFTSQDVNRMLSLCTDVIRFVVCDISLSEFRTPVYFHRVVNIKLVSCFVLTMGTTNLLTHSAINSVTLMRPRFFQNQADVVGPRVYGPPRLLPCLAICRSTLRDIYRVCRCLSTHRIAVERLEPDIIQSRDAVESLALTACITMPLINGSVKYLLIHAIGTFILVCSDYYSHSWCCRHPATLPDKSQSLFVDQHRVLRLLWDNHYTNKHQ